MYDGTAAGAASGTGGNGALENPTAMLPLLARGRGRGGTLIVLDKPAAVSFGDVTNEPGNDADKDPDDER